MEKEAECYKDGTYTLPLVKGFDPFGVLENCKFECDSCGNVSTLNNCITHNVQRSESNKDRKGSHGHYTQVSYYCSSCYPTMESLARKIHK